MSKLLSCALAVLLGGLSPLLVHRAAHAQGVAALLPAPAEKPAKAEPPPLSPAETKQMLDLLNDPQKRAAFTATLETLSKASAAANPAKPAAAPVKLAPDSVGAQVLRDGTVWLGSLSGQLASFGRVLGDLPSVWSFTVRTMQNPVLRARAIENQAFVLAPAQWGRHSEKRVTFGNALIADPWGTVVARCPEGEGFALARYDAEQLQRVRRDLPALRHRTL